MPIDRSNNRGRFDRRIIFEQPVATTDSFGQGEFGPQAAEGAWTLVLECWAHLEDEYGIEQKQSNREVREQWTVIQVDYRIGLRLDATMRARDKTYGTIWDIRSVQTRVLTTYENRPHRIAEMNCVQVL